MMELRSLNNLNLSFWYLYSYYYYILIIIYILLAFMDLITSIRFLTTIIFVKIFAVYTLQLKLKNNLNK